METSATSLAVPRVPSWALSVAIFGVSVAVMFWVRLVVYPGDVIALTYGLPLLLCLWHRDRRLLWAMTAAFLAMATYKNFYLISVPTEVGVPRVVQWSMQAINLLLIGGTVHVILTLTQTLRARNAALEKANESLIERDTEITRQNEELQSQAEELTLQNEEIQQQNEEIQQQSEEVNQQAEELQAQAEQLRNAHEALLRRENVLQTLLGSLETADEQHDLPSRVCVPLVELFEGAAAGAVVFERDGDDLVVLAEEGRLRSKGDRVPYTNTLASIAIEKQATAFIEDTRKRPDLAVPAKGGSFARSILATPLRIGGSVIGAVTVYSFIPRSWTETDFRIIEWAAAQCGLLLTARRLQRQLSNANAELDTTVRERTSELTELVTELEHFSYTIAHDLRAPLRALQGYSELLMDASATLDEKNKKYLQRISSASARMDRLITDALAFSRTIRGEMPLEPLEPEPLIRGIVESYPPLQIAGAEITINGPLPRVVANEAGLTQCFSNLLGNAVKFVKPDETPRIRISAARQGEMVRLMVEDNGIGVPEELQGRVFGMFYRVHRGYEGTGIGLALVRKVAERMGGAVGLESSEGAGSRFWIELKGADGSNDSHG